MTRRHRRRPRHVLDEGDLAEPVAAAQQADVVPALAHAHLAAGDGVEAVSLVALADHDVAGGDRDRLERPRQSLELGRRQRREDGDQPQQLDLDLRHVGGVVDAAQPPPRQGDERRAGARRCR